MAWRDSRRNLGRLMLFMSSIVIGIGALVAINSFGDNLRHQIEAEAKELLGADLEVESQTPIPEDITYFFDSLGFETSAEINCASMVLFPKNGGTRLINVRAVESSFPFYGSIETQPEDVASSLALSQKALVDQTLLMQFDASVGDSVKVGELTFGIEGSVLSVPGQAAITTTVAPPVFIPFRLMEASGLMQKGSRMNYLLHVKYPEGIDQAFFEEIVKPRLERTQLQFDDVAERKQEVGDAYADLTGFLNLTAFIALLLGCIGVASSVHIYMKEKVQSVAVLRCLGASGKEAMAVFLVQILIMGIIGSTLGSILGTAVQYYLPALFGDFLPIEVDIRLSTTAILEGLALGIVSSVLFALFPLLRIRRISPLRAIRASFESQEADRLPYLVFGLILVFIVSFSWLQLGALNQALYFSAGLLLSFALLAGVAQLIIWLVRKYFPTGGSFLLRQSLANLYRPNNQTLILVVTIGLGTALITTLFLSQGLLVDKVRFSSASADRPNMVLFDIQTNQLPSVKEIFHSHDLEIMGEVPIVTMRLHDLMGRSVEELMSDTVTGVKSWVLNREYRVSYRDSLTESETIIAGVWYPRVEKPGDPIYISLEERLADDMAAGVGDAMSFNVQGAVINTVVGSIRKVDWQRMQTNFLVVFPEGVLEEAPKFHVMLARFDSTAQSAVFQRSVVQEFPNISIIDLNLILQTVDSVLSKVSFVIRFMAFFSILTGLLVLTGSVIVSKYQRIEESVLLRTLGASRAQIFKINVLEYFLLGSIAAFTGIFIALGAGWALASFSFDSDFRPDAVPLILGYLAITLLTVFIGLSNSRSVVMKPPLEILRSEV